MKKAPLHPPVPAWDGHCEDALFNERGTAFAQQRGPMGWVIGAIGWAILIGILIGKGFF